MKTTQAQRLLLFMGLVGAFAILMASWAVFGVPVETTGIYGVEGLRARMEAVQPGTVDLAFLIAVMSLPLMVGGITGFMLELRKTEKRVRWSMMGGVAVWILTIAAFVGAVRILGAGLEHLPADTEWPAEMETIFNGLSWLAIGSTMLLWLGLSLSIARGALPVPRQWVWLSPGVLLVAFLALAWVKGLVTGEPATRELVLAPWAALMVSFAALLVVRWRKGLEE